MEPNLKLHTLLINSLTSKLSHFRALPRMPITITHIYISSTNAPHHNIEPRLTYSQRRSSAHPQNSSIRLLCIGYGPTTRTNNPSAPYSPKSRIKYLTAIAANRHPTTYVVTRAAEESAR